MHLAKKHRPYFRIVRVCSLIPYFSVRIAEPAVGTQALRIEKSKDRAVEYSCLRGIGCALRRFGAVKANVCMSAVAEWGIM